MDIIDTFEKQALASAQISDAASKATIVGGAGTSVYTLFGGDMMLSTIGIICTICTFLVNWYYKRREHNLNERKLEMEYDMRMLAEQRRQQIADAQIAAMKSGCAIPPQAPDTTRGAPL